jgi:hypothetical protein
MNVMFSLLVYSLLLYTYLLSPFFFALNLFPLSSTLVLLSPLWSFLWLEQQTTVFMDTVFCCLGFYQWSKGSSSQYLTKRLQLMIKSRWWFFMCGFSAQKPYFKQASLNVQMILFLADPWPPFACGNTRGGVCPTCKK